MAHPTPGSKLSSALGRVLLTDRDRFVPWREGTGREIEIELVDDPSVRVRVVDWKQERRHGDPVKVTGTVEAIRPWKSGGRSFVTVTLNRKGYRVTIAQDVEEPKVSTVEPEAPTAPAADEPDNVIDGIWLF